jgi:precorrin-2 dehydrogenase / sirohydrochlorin ferrochelatase
LNEILYPISVRLHDRPVAVIGAGRIATDKVRGLLRCGARVTVVAPEAVDAIVHAAGEGRIEWHCRSFEPADLDGAILVVAATERPEVNQEVVRAAHARNLLVNAVDDPERCDYHVPSVVRRGPLTLAISTGGASPAAAAQLRRELEAVYGEGTGHWLELVGAFRARVQQDFASDAALRKDLGLEAARCQARQLAEAGDIEGARGVLEGLIARAHASRDGETP